MCVSCLPLKQKSALNRKLKLIGVQLGWNSCKSGTTRESGRGVFCVILLELLIIRTKRVDVCNPYSVATVVTHYWVGEV